LLQIAFCFNEVPDVRQSSQGHMILHSKPIVCPCWLEGMVGVS